MSPVRPICLVCSRNARTVDTPRVRVRVEHATIMRDPIGLKVLWRCHGAAGVTFLAPASEEAHVEALEVGNG